VRERGSFIFYEKTTSRGSKGPERNTGNSLRGVGIGSTASMVGRTHWAENSTGGALEIKSLTPWPRPGGPLNREGPDGRGEDSEDVENGWSKQDCWELN